MAYLPILFLCKMLSSLLGQIQQLSKYLSHAYAGPNLGYRFACK